MSRAEAIGRLIGGLLSLGIICVMLLIAGRLWKRYGWRGFDVWAWLENRWDQLKGDGEKEG